VIENRKRKLGEDHRGTLTSMANVAFTWKSSAYDAEAIDLLLDCLNRPDATILSNSVSSIEVNILARDSVFQYDSILETEPSRKWISVFRTRVRERFYESKVVKLISIHTVYSN
jgi:hypothetical protein